MTRRIHFLLLALIFSLSSCNNEPDLPAPAVIKGNFFLSDSKLYLDEVHAGHVKSLDSVNISENGDFQFTVNSQEYSLFKLILEGLYPIIVVARNGDTIRVDQTNDPAWPYTVSGNDECMLLATYLEKLKRDEHKVDSLSMIFHNSQSHPDFLIIRDELNRKFVKIHESHKEWAREFVIKQPGTFASLVMINSYFREFLLFDQKDDFKYYEIVADAVLRTMPENQYAIDLNDHVERIRITNKKDKEAMARLAPGKAIPDFDVFTADSTRLNPKTFRDKNLLIYFWSSNTAPSRQANAFIKKAYEDFNEKGLELLTISFDRSVRSWQGAIGLDELPGFHCIETRGPGSPVQKLFNIKMHLPLYYLVDKEGYIFSHGRDFSDMLKEAHELTHMLPKN